MTKAFELIEKKLLYKKVKIENFSKFSLFFSSVFYFEFDIKKNFFIHLIDRKLISYKKSSFEIFSTSFSRCIKYNLKNDTFC